MTTSETNPVLNALADRIERRADVERQHAASLRAGVAKALAIAVILDRIVAIVRTGGCTDMEAIIAAGDGPGFSILGETDEQRLRRLCTTFGLTEPTL